MSNSALSALGLDVRKYDRERFVTALFAPPLQREDLLVLYAFNAELARIKTVVRESLAGSIRLQWWRDVVLGQRPATEVDHHPIAGPLGALLTAGRVDAQPLLDLLDAREQDLTKAEFASVAQLVGYVNATAGNLNLAALQVLGVSDDASRAAGQGAAIAYGLIGLLRSLPANLSQGWQVLPRDVVLAAGLDAQGITAKTDLTRPVQQIAGQAQTTLKIARQSRLARSGMAVGLQGTLAQGHLRQLDQAGWNVFAPQIARPQTMPLRLVWHALWGRI